MPRRKQPAIPDELLDELLGGSDPRGALAEGGLLDGLKKALAERALNAELDHHLDGGEPDGRTNRSEEHTSELQSRQYLVCRLLLEKKEIPAASHLYATDHARNN